MTQCRYSSGNISQAAGTVVTVGAGDVTGSWTLGAQAHLEVTSSYLFLHVNIINSCQVYTLTVSIFVSKLPS